MPTGTKKVDNSHFEKWLQEEIEAEKKKKAEEANNAPVIDLVNPFPFSHTFPTVKQLAFHLVSRIQDRCVAWGGHRGNASTFQQAMLKNAGKDEKNAADYGLKSGPGRNIIGSAAASIPGAPIYGQQPGTCGVGVGNSNASAAAAEPGALRYGLQPDARGAAVGSSNGFANLLDQFPEHNMVVTDTTSRSRSVLSLRDGLDFYTKKVFEKQFGTPVNSSMIERMLDGQQIQSHGFIYTIERASSTSNNASVSTASDLLTTPSSTLSSSAAVGPLSSPSVVVGPWYLVNNRSHPFVNEPRTSTSDPVTGFLTAHKNGALTIIGHQVLHQLKTNPEVAKIFTTQAFAFGFLEKNKPGRVFSDLDVLIEEAKRICKNKGFTAHQLSRMDKAKKTLLTSGNHFSKLLDTFFIFVAHQGVGPTRAKKSSNGVITKSGRYKSKSKKSKSKSSRKSSKSSKVKTSNSSSAKAGSKRPRDEEDDEGDDDDDDDDEDDEDDEDDDSVVIISIDD